MFIEKADRIEYLPTNQESETRAGLYIPDRFVLTSIQLSRGDIVQTACIPIESKAPGRQQMLIPPAPERLRGNQADIPMSPNGFDHFADGVRLNQGIVIYECEKSDVQVVEDPFRAEISATGDPSVLRAAQDGYVGKKMLDGIR